jgi:nitric oxide dioxygenase
VFLSAGIGVTPIAGMLSHLVAAGSDLPVRVLHADVDESSFALRRQVLADVETLPAASLHVWYERGATTTMPVDGVYAGQMDLSQVDLLGDALYYMCGPLPFMQAVRNALIQRGVPPRDIQYEVFGPDLWQADTDEGAGDAPEPGAHDALGPEERQGSRQVWTRPEAAVRTTR